MPTLQQGRPAKNLAKPHNIKLEQSIDDLLRQRHSDTGIALVEIIRRAVSRDLCGGLPVLGEISCGDLQAAIAESENFVDPGNALDWKPEDFLLRAKGDSMAPRIQDGDLVLLRRDVSLQMGEIAAVQVYGNGDHEGQCEATLKRVFYAEGDDTMLLKPLNPNHEQRRVRAELVTIAGVYRGHISQ